MLGVVSLKNLYWLKHERIIENRNGEEIYSTLDIGVYSSREKALSKVQKYKALLGFRDYPDGFQIETVRIEYNPKSPEKILDDTVYELWHEYEVLDKRGSYDYDV